MLTSAEGKSSYSGIRDGLLSVPTTCCRGQVYTLRGTRTPYTYNKPRRSRSCHQRIYDDGGTYQLQQDPSTMILIYRVAARSDKCFALGRYGFLVCLSSSFTINHRCPSSQITMFLSCLRKTCRRSGNNNRVMATTTGHMDCFSPTPNLFVRVGKMPPSCVSSFHVVG